MEDYKAQYSAEIDRFGNVEITDNDTGKSCYLQGDDSIDLRDTMEYMEDIEYPSGPFTCYEMHLDVILSDYSDILE